MTSCGERINCKGSHDHDLARTVLGQPHLGSYEGNLARLESELQAPWANEDKALRSIPTKKR
jgi:hypothetical protein